MKILLITDQHFGVRNDNLFFQELYRKFYSEVVLPYIDREGITQVICLGDTFDRRKFVNFNSLDAAREMWFQPLADRGIRMSMIIGNHDIYYKNTLKVNAPELLLSDYNNIEVITEPTAKKFGKRNFLLIPWICDGNREKVYSKLKASKASVCLGHLELNGFEVIPGLKMDHGYDRQPFEKFDLTCSGHYHMKTNQGPIHYLGNPYQLYWNDYGHDRGFHVLNTDDLELEFITNPFNTFNKIYYKDDIDVSTFPQLEGTYVKLIVGEKQDQVKFDRCVRKLQQVNLADLKIVEDVTQETGEIDGEIEVEDTLSILESCVSEFTNREEIFSILKSLYVEALEV
jgi:DNA repair exonuclease SbcCD nuclease subunit